MPTHIYSNPLEIVDISEINQDTADKLLHAASTQGFLMLEGHGFSQEEVDQLYNLSAKFFTEVPLEEKQKYPIDKRNRGYTGMGVENLELDQLDKKVGDPKECFNFAAMNLAAGVPDQKLPTLFRDNMDTISKTVLKLREDTKKILKLLAMGLQVDEKKGGSDWFVMRHSDTRPSGTTFRLLHYHSPVKPGASNEEKDKYREVNIAGAHTDYGGLTLLFQKEGEDGLQILSPMTKKWEAVPFVAASPKFATNGDAPPLIVNIADQLSYWTNGLLRSTVHRVRFAEKSLDEGKDRYSIVMFSHPSDDTLLEPVPSKLISSEDTRGASQYLLKHGRSQTAGEHLARRLASTYGWY
ncbi:DEBR0S5_01706g1_1 [Brettanomyces bruxellensis]|uniref:DEBR0S5_01706g1_1 n=1 Tax=Dekkera bruxellensis TaxID=5007 RepID=A0A7D9CZ87_DEKBR|nr:DEBR0S5_01706g1_1 [Brettanomyces bruxellensis]